MTKEIIIRRLIPEDAPALTVRHPESIVCETGNTVVDKSSRGQGLLLKLGMAQYLPQKH